jgi:hypothetical protein
MMPVRFVLCVDGEASRLIETQGADHGGKFIREDFTGARTCWEDPDNENGV